MIYHLFYCYRAIGNHAYDYRTDFRGNLEVLKNILGNILTLNVDQEPCILAKIPKILNQDTCTQEFFAGFVHCVTLLCSYMY